MEPSLIIDNSSVNTTRTIAILVSDNVADETLVDMVINATNGLFKKYTTEWGIYDEAVAIEIISEEPEKVIIVGGTEAVPNEYDEVFAKYGIETLRIGGETRYETNKEFIEYVLENWGDMLNTSLFVAVNGDDELLLEITKNITEKSLPVLVRDDKNLELLNHLPQMANKSLILVNLNITKLNASKDVRIVSLNLTGEYMKERLSNKYEELSKKIKELLDEVRELKENDKVNPEEVEKIEKLLSRSMEELQYAKTNTSVRESYKHLKTAEFLYSRAKIEFTKLVQNNIALKIRERLRAYMQLSNVLEEKGFVNQSLRIRNTISIISSLVEEGKYEEAKKKLDELNSYVRDLMKVERKHEMAKHLMKKVEFVENVARENGYSDLVELIEEYKGNITGMIKEGDYAGALNLTQYLLKEVVQVIREHYKVEFDVITPDVINNKSEIPIKILIKKGDVKNVRIFVTNEPRYLVTEDMNQSVVWYKERLVLLKVPSIVKVNGRDVRINRMTNYGVIITVPYSVLKDFENITSIELETAIIQKQWRLPIIEGSRTYYIHVVVNDIFHIAKPAKVHIDSTGKLYDRNIIVVPRKG